jgi:Cytochrome P460
MNAFIRWVVPICGAFSVLAASPVPHSTQSVDYPEGYRHWTHVKSALIGPESPAHKRFGGLHHIYANNLAMQGFETGEFPDGSVLVFDLLETQSKDGVTTEGTRRFIDVMQKDSEAFEETGGWGFEEFRGDSQTERSLNEQTRAECFACHTSRKQQGFVFSSFRE